MITSREEYESKILQLSQFPQSLLARLPESEKIYNIDLNSREVESPTLLSITNDHEAEIIYFKVARYFDAQDLLKTSCIIVFTNALNETYFYNVPIVDAYTFSDPKDSYLLIPWAISQDVTKKAGVVKFAFKFYIIDGGLNFEYILNTKPATTKVEQGLEPSYISVEITEEEYNSNISKSYFVKNKNGKYVLGGPTYDPKETYYMWAEEARITPASKLEAIYQQIQELTKGQLKWMEI